MMLKKVFGVCSALLLAFVIDYVNTDSVSGDLSNENRQKRSPASVIVPRKWVLNVFMKDSMPMPASALLRVNWSSKSGGFRRAISEFKSFSPTAMRRTKEGNGVEGTIGDLRVSVQRDGPNKNQATVTIKELITHKTTNIIWYD